MKRLWFVTLATLLGSCSDTSPAVFSEVGVAAPGDSLSPDTRVILDSTRTQDLLRQCTRKAPQSTSGTWTPTQQQVEGADARIVPLLRRVLPKLRVNDQPVQDINPKAYFRQYAGITRGTRRLLYINAFMPDSLDRADARWKTEPKIICDGGPALFGAQYDPARLRFVDLDFNDAVNGPVRY